MLLNRSRFRAVWTQYKATGKAAYLEVEQTPQEKQAGTEYRHGSMAEVKEVTCSGKHRREKGIKQRWGDAARQQRRDASTILPDKGMKEVEQHENGEWAVCSRAVGGVRNPLSSSFAICS